MIGRATQFTQAGGAAAIATGDVVIRKLILTPAAAVATVTIKENGAGGADKISLQAAANGNSVFVDGPISIKDPYLSAIGGAGATLTVVM